ncbi:MAG TPA: hypothetical protein DEF35_07305 [Paenibacillus sp.]|nr:hypothetical protein P364_0109070 [Paenibacillus sp. MAEPY2]KGP87843.1 hypothetical protein P363_0109260 [Paenibacillus sp. MAEPY1]OZQ61029.1 hypothetical protein CA599_28990 [Paenibacillus taichungensis]HBU81433.1 hypothetical protein [Paenibacillus sp.]
MFAKEGNLLAEEDLSDYRCLFVRGLGEEVLDIEVRMNERAHESGHIRPFHGLLSFFIIGLNS